MEGICQLGHKKRVRDDSDEWDLDSPEVKRLRDDLLGGLDDSDLFAASADLDSFMRSFAEEITPSPPPPAADVVDLTSDPVESQPNLGFLLEASDDELGLPPSMTTTSSEEVVELTRVPSNSSDEFSDLWRFDEQIPSYYSLDYAFAGGEEDNYNGNSNGGYVAFDGLFDSSDDVGLYGDSVQLWRPETMPAQ
ncbi:hypothetical protein NMG60_11036035 [Bertholletia excelsa]